MGIGLKTNATDLEQIAINAMNDYSNKLSDSIANPNIIINGNFDIWQRNTSFDIQKIKTYTADRWYADTIGSIVTKEICDLPYSLYCLRVINNELNLDTLTIGQIFEDCEKYINSSLTLSFYARAVGVSNKSFKYKLGLDCVGQTILTPEWKKITLCCENFKTFTDSYKNQGLTFYADEDDLFEMGEGFEIAQVKVEVGNIATNFIPQNYTVELSQCQRYYQLRSTSTIADVDLRPNMRVTPKKTSVSTGIYSYDAEL